MVTILMAVYNGEPYLKEQLDSIAGQTWTKWRLMIRDDGSSDGSLDTLRAFAGRVSQEVQILENKPASGSARKNFAWLLQDAAAYVKNQSGEQYFMCCDQDDIWKEDKIEKTLKYMQTCEAKAGDVPVLVHTDLEVVDANGNRMAESMFAMSGLRKDPVRMQLLMQNNVTGCTMMMNRSLLCLIAPYADAPQVIMHDHWAALAAKFFGVLGYIEEPLLCYRQHGDNSVGSKDSKNSHYLWKRLKDGKELYRKEMQRSFEQTGYFLSCYEEMIRAGEGERQWQKYREYAALADKSKTGRIRYYIQNHVWKKGIARKIMQILWG